MALKRSFALMGLITVCSAGVFGAIAWGVVSIRPKPAAISLPVRPPFATNLQQRAFLSYVQLELSQPGRAGDLDLDASLIGAARAADLASLSMTRVVRELVEGTGIQVSDEGGLVGEYREALTAYLQGSEDAVRRYWEANDLRPIDADCPCNSPGMWEARTRTLRGARLSSVVAFARPRFVEGAEVETEFTLPVSSISERSGRYPRVDQPSQWGLTCIELIVPVEARDTNGDSFVGYLGLWMTFDHVADTPRWVLAKISIYDRPDLIGVVLPNL